MNSNPAARRGSGLSISVPSSSSGCHLAGVAR
jgi:hypothetical protein